ncbi:MAG: dihydrofolate reductase [Ruminococcaceae bacterium]|nr:dihydrofolate reductase [Oscillospiraceae bacterium]
MVSLIVAYDRNKLIGKEGKMPWFIDGELRRFRELTTGNVVIMGRKTIEAIGKPLPNRVNIVISRDKNYDGCIMARSFDEAMEKARETGLEIYITGGSTVYAPAIDIVDKMYITEIDAEYEGDTYFPDFDENDFIRTVDEEITEPVPYKYCTFTRKK